MKKTPPNNASLYSSRIIQTYINLLKSRYTHVDTEELLAYAGMQPHQVADQWHWFSQEQINRFYDRLVAQTGNRDIAREAGRHAASADSIGVVRHYVLGFLNPARLYQQIGKIAPKFTRSSRYESRSLGKQRIEITVTPYEGVREREFQCLNRFGFLEAVVMAFCNTLPRIEHPECIFRGDSCCRYVISWPQPRFKLLKKLRIFGILTGLAALPVLYLPHLAPALHPFLTICLPAFLIFWICLDSVEKTVLRRSLKNLRLSSDTMINQMERNYNNALLVNTIAQSVTRETNGANVIDSLVRNFRKHLDFDAGMIFLVDDERRVLSYSAGYGCTPTLENWLKNTSFGLDDPCSSNIFIHALRENRPVLVNSADHSRSDPSPIPEPIEEAGFQSFICCPIVYNNTAVGTLAAGNGKVGTPMSDRDTSLLYGIAPVIGISLHNARLLQNREQQFNAMLQALAATIDARDPLTAGHSKRVNRFSLGICRQLDLCEEECEKIRVAALLHDYGKIAIPDAILKKPGRLSANEYELVKQHALHTRQALENINFEGIYKDVPAIAGAHHEKINGSGYPDGLAGPEIPFGAKVVAVADFFEAITSRRHYRTPMPHLVAIRELRKRRGIHFEPTIVDAFLKYIECEWENEETEDRSPHFTAQLSRETIRVPCHCHLTIRYWDIPIQATIIDISTHGLFAATPLSAHEGAQVKLLFTLPERDDAPLEIDGRVVWTNHSCLPRKPLFPAGLGIAFTALDEEQSGVLTRFVRSRIECSEQAPAAALLWGS